MTLLVAGLALFVVLHLIPSVPPLRAALVARMGDMPYRGVFSILRVREPRDGGVGFRGPHRSSPSTPLRAGAATRQWGWCPSRWSCSRRPTCRPISGRWSGIPCCSGCCVWALAHLAANGDLRSVVLFGAFAGFAVVAAVSAVARGKGPAGDKAPRLAMDAPALVSGAVAAGLFAYFHAALFGVPVI